MGRDHFRRLKSRDTNVEVSVLRVRSLLHRVLPSNVLWGKVVTKSLRADEKRVEITFGGWNPGTPTWRFLYCPSCRLWCHVKPSLQQQHLCDRTRCNHFETNQHRYLISNLIFGPSPNCLSSAACLGFVFWIQRIQTAARDCGDEGDCGSAMAVDMRSRCYLGLMFFFAVGVILSDGADPESRMTVVWYDTIHSRLVVIYSCFFVFVSYPRAVCYDNFTPPFKIHCFCSSPSRSFGISNNEIDSNSANFAALMIYC